MNTLINRIRFNWSWPRMLRVSLGAIGIPTAVYADSWLLGLISAVFLVQGLFALGCESNGCAVPSNFTQSETETESSDQHI